MSQMIEVKTADLIGPALNYATAIADGWDFSRQFYQVMFQGYCPSTDWAQGGPLIEKLMRSGKWELVPWFGGVLFQNCTSECIPVDGQSWDVQSVLATGKTVLIAACRATVYAQLGDTVSVPAELVGGEK